MRRSRAETWFAENRRASALDMPEWHHRMALVPVDRTDDPPCGGHGHGMDARAIGDGSPGPRADEVFDPGSSSEFTETMDDAFGQDDGILDANDEMASLLRDAGSRSPGDAAWVAAAEDTRGELQVSSSICPAGACASCSRVERRVFPPTRGRTSARCPARTGSTASSPSGPKGRGLVGRPPLMRGHRSVSMAGPQRSDSIGSGRGAAW